MGSFMSMLTSFLRLGVRVSFVGGLTTIFNDWLRGSTNQCFGTWMYSISLGFFFD